MTNEPFSFIQPYLYSAEVAYYSWQPKDFTEAVIIKINQDIIDDESPFCLLTFCKKTFFEDAQCSSLKHDLFIRDAKSRCYSHLTASSLSLGFQRLALIAIPSLDTNLDIWELYVLNNIFRFPSEFVKELQAQKDEALNCNLPSTKDESDYFHDCIAIEDEIRKIQDEIFVLETSVKKTKNVQLKHLKEISLPDNAADIKIKETLENLLKAIEFSLEIVNENIPSALSNSNGSGSSSGQLTKLEYFNYLDKYERNSVELNLNALDLLIKTNE